MKFLNTTVFAFIANGIGLYLANVYIPGFSIASDLKQIGIAAAALTVINLVARPILKHIFWPLMILTLGLFGIVVNIVAIYLLDYFLHSITISGFLPLLYATLIIAGVNIVVTIIAKI
ncbi:MAG: phage holin family protein, partial [Patescibacteria group bacterium]|nr:phage holin family protein [Patescibacteria group bacterium]